MHEERPQLTRPAARHAPASMLVAAAAPPAAAGGPPPGPPALASLRDAGLRAPGMPCGGEGRAFDFAMAT